MKTATIISSLLGAVVYMIGFAITDFTVGAVLSLLLPCVACLVVALTARNDDKKAVLWISGVATILLALNLGIGLASGATTVGVFVIAVVLQLWAPIGVIYGASPDRQ